MSGPDTPRRIEVLTLALLLALVGPAVGQAASLQLTQNAVAETGTDAAIDGAGNTHVVYEREGTVYYRARTADGWQDEEEVATGTNPAVGAGVSGAPQVVFLSAGSIWHTARPSGSWLSPVAIGAGSTADLAVGPNDVAHVVYMGNIGDGDGYEEMNYTHNATGSFPTSPVQTWDAWYDGSAAVYYYSPTIAAYGESGYAIGYRLYQMWRASSWTDWYTSNHVYRSISGDDLSSPGWYKATYPDPQHNSLVLTPDGTAYFAYGTTLATANGTDWIETALPAGSSYSVALTAGALHLGYVDGTGGVYYVSASGSGLGTPALIDPTTSGRNTVVVAGAKPFLLYEAVDSGDHEVWFAKTSNEAPVLASIGDRSVDEGEVLSFTVSATDGDGDGITYEAATLPPGATLDADTGAFSWTPDYDQAGTYADIVFTVDDGTATDSETITITVNDVNAPPVLDSIGNRSVAEGATLSFTVVATDPDGNGLLYSASNLPAGATFDAGTQVFGWTPGYDQAGPHAGVVFTATDDGTPSESDAETITITVTDVNRAPVLGSIGNRSVDEGETLSFSVSATDPDDDTLTFAAASLPTGAAFDPVTRTFSWTPGHEQAGEHAGLVFSVTDDGTPALDDSETITVTVNDVNRAPVLAAIGDQSVAEGATMAFTVSATDADGHALTYSASNLPAGAAFDPGTRAFSWSPGYDRAGAYTGVVFTVTDAGTPNQSDSETITLTVTDAAAAAVSIANAEVAEGHDGTRDLVFTLTLSQAAALPVSVAWGTADGSATAGSDYTAASGTVTFDPGVTSRTVGVSITGDRRPEPDETFQVVLSSPVGLTLPASAAEGRILTDERAAYDLDGDGHADIVWRHTGGALYVWQMDGTDLEASSYLPPISLAWTIHGTGDFNGDGKSDLLWRETASGDTYIWLMDGPTGIGAGYTGSQANNTWTIQGVGDFDGDGKSDILWRHTGGALYIWQMDGTAIKASSFLPPISTAWEIKGLGDFDGDGKTDILWREASSGDAYVWFMDGASATGSGYTASQANNSWVIQGLGDFDADGKSDILWRHTGGALYVWQMDGTELKASSYLPPISLSWTIQQLGDFNADGKTDILWRETASGDTYEWLMDGATALGSGYTASQANNDWVIQAR